MKKWILLIVLAGSFSAHAQQVKAKTNTTTTHSKTAVNVSDSDEIYYYSAIFDLDKSKKAINEIEKVFGKGKKEAIESYNKRISENGLFSDGLRSF